MKTAVLKTVSEYRAWRQADVDSESLGFVPTMGGLHEGHFSLARRSLEENERTVASVYLNRPQFNNASDFETYPSSFDEDMAELEEMGVDAVFAPTYETMYPDDYRYRIVENDLSTVFEGAHRPGHFDGVLTVVMKLLNIVRPTRAYFGEKDWQQLQLVKGMVEAFFMETEIVPCPTARGEGGLALSSRNRRLSNVGLKRAERINQILNTAESVHAAEANLREEGFDVEYVAEREGRRLTAVQVEGVRLIDNVQVGGARHQSSERRLECNLGGDAG